MCNKNRAKEYYKNNRDIILNRSKEYYKQQRISIRAFKKQKIKDYQKEYQKEYKKI